MKKTVTGLLAGMIFGVTGLGPVVADDTTSVVELFFMEQEKGIEPYPMRMLVSPDYLRFDDGVDQGDFLLLRRSDGTIFNVVHSDESVLEIPRVAVSSGMPSPAQVSEDTNVLADAPKVDGESARSFEQTVEGKSCVKAVVIPGLFPEVVAALEEFHLTMAGQQEATLGNMPEEMRTLCLLNRLVYSRAPYLQHGFPMLVTDQQGYKRQYLDYRKRDEAGSDLFLIPDRYERSRIGGAPPLSAGQMDI